MQSSASLTPAVIDLDSTSNWPRETADSQSECCPSAVQPRKTSCPEGSAVAGVVCNAITVARAMTLRERTGMWAEIVDFAGLMAIPFTRLDISDTGQTTIVDGHHPRASARDYPDSTWMPLQLTSIICPQATRMNESSDGYNLYHIVKPSVRQPASLAMVSTRENPRKRDRLVPLLMADQAQMTAASSAPCRMARLASSSAATSAPPMMCTGLPAACNPACSSLRGSCPAQMIT